MNFSRARLKARVIAGRRFVIVYLGWTTQRQWVSTSFISRRFIPLATRIAKAGITRSYASRAIPACHGRSAAKLADTRQSSLHSGHWKILIGYRKKCESEEWKSPSISRSIVRQIIPTSKSTPIGSTNAPTARSNTRRTRRKSTKIFIH